MLNCTKSHEPESEAEAEPEPETEPELKPTSGSTPGLSVNIKTYVSTFSTLFISFAKNIKPKMFNLKPSPVSLEVFFTLFVVSLTKLMGFFINQLILKNFERTLIKLNLIK